MSAFGTSVIRGEDSYAVPGYRPRGYAAEGYRARGYAPENYAVSGAKGPAVVDVGSDDNDSSYVAAVETPAPSKGLVLPSASSAERLVRGEPGALPLVGLHLLGRAALVGTGIALVNGLNMKTMKYALAGSAAIEVFVLGYAAYKASQEGEKAPSPS